MTGDHSSSSMSTSSKAILLYSIVMFSVFFFKPEIPLADLDSSLTTGSEAFIVGTTYLEVIGVFNLMICLRQCPGAQGYWMASCAWCVLMLKHAFFNGLIPPPPVIAMGVASLAASFFSKFQGGKAGQWVFLASMGVIAGVFLFDPATPLGDSFPNLSGKALKIGVILCEVVGFHAAMLFLSCCPAPFGNMMAFGFLLASFAKHMQVDNIMPPVPVMLAASIVFSLCLNDVLAGRGHNKTA